MYSDNPIADQAKNGQMKSKMKQNLQGILKLYNVVEGVDVEVIQHGSQSFEINEVIIAQNLTLGDEDISAIEVMALELARQTPEDQWDYRLVD